MTKTSLLRAILRRLGLVPMVGAHDARSKPRPFHEADGPDTFEDYQRPWVEIKS